MFQILREEEEKLYWMCITHTTTYTINEKNKIEKKLQK